MWTKSGNRRNPDQGKILNHYSSGIVGKHRLLVTVLTLAVTGTCYADVLEEVVVTAQKREQNMNDIGVSVTAYTGSQLRDLGLDNTGDLQLFTPGLTYTEAGGAPSPAIFAIRGISQSDFSDHHEGPNAFYTDGAYISFSGAAGLALYDVERVEVLRGPQGTLFGRNATGGLIQVISAKPTEEFEAYVNITMGDFSTYEFAGAVSGPVSENVLGRIAVSSNNSDGWFKNGGPSGKGNEVRNLNVRGQLQFNVSDITDILWNVRMTRDDGGSAGQADALLGYPTNDDTISQDDPDFNYDDFVAFCAGFFFITPSAPGQDCFGEALDPKAFRENTNFGGFDRDYFGSTLTVTSELAGRDITLTAITDYQQIESQYLEDSDKTILTTGNFNPHQDSSQFSQEVNLTESEGAFRWQTGIYYLQIDGSYDTSFGGFDGDFLSSSIYTLDTKTYAGFIQTEFDLSDTWMLLTGFRVTHDKKKLNYSGTCIIFSEPINCNDFDFFNSPNPLQEIQGYTDSISDTDYAFKIEADWKPADTTLLYGSVTRGNKGGGFSVSVFTDAAPGQIAFKPEVITSYEIGFKQSLFDGQAQLNGSVFYYDYSDHQANTFDGQAVTIINVNAEVTGFDLELTSGFGNGWELMLGLAVLDTRAKDVPLGENFTADRKLGLAPDFTANGLIRKTWQLGSGSIAAQLLASRVNDRFLSVVNEQATLIAGYTRTDARLTYYPNDGDWSASVFAKNLSDGLHEVHRFNETETNGTVSVQYDTPLYVGVNFTKHW